METLLEPAGAFDGPVVVCGTGGSGTRVVYEILKWAGVYPGRSCNAAGDSIPFHLWMEYVLPALRNGTLDRKEARRGLSKAIIQHLDEHVFKAIAQGRPVKWMIKNPRAMYLVSILAPAFHKMTFIQVVRDGRDMALTHTKTAYDILGLPEDDRPECVKIAESWSYWNVWAARKAMDLGLKGMLVRLEDLIEDPVEVGNEICACVGVDNLEEDVLLDLVKRPSTLGRWKGHEHESAITGAAERGLQFFGYGASVEDPVCSGHGDAP